MTALRVQTLRLPRQALFAAAAAVLAIGATWPGDQHGAAAPQAVPGFTVFHLDSELAPGPSLFREVFVVDSIAGITAETGQLEIRRDGAPFNVTWDEPGPLRRNATFWFVQEAFDQQQVLTGHLDGVQVMECRYGGAAGRWGLWPDELRAMGQGHLVRCLDDIDDG